MTRMHPRWHWLQSGVGLEVGAAVVGLFEGARVGAEVGAAVVGLLEGARVGPEVGLLVGAAVGTDVHPHARGPAQKLSNPSGQPEKTGVARSRGSR